MTHRDEPNVTVELTTDEAWLVYDLLIGRGEPLAAKEEEAMMNLGALKYLAPARKVRAAACSRCPDTGEAGT